MFYVIAYFLIGFVALGLHLRRTGDTEPVLAAMVLLIWPVILLFLLWAVFVDAFEKLVGSK